MPLPGTRVIHPRWAEHHRPVAEGGMTATVSLRLPGATATGAFDDDTGNTPTAPHAPYHTGPARIQAMSTRAQEALAAEQQVTTLAYLVSVEWDAATGEQDVAAKHLVHVDAVDANGDPTLVGRDLVVQEVVHGSLVFERDLICTD